jgi:hypothetical protein
MSTSQMTPADVQEIVKSYLDENLGPLVDARLDARLDLKLLASRQALLGDLQKMLAARAPSAGAAAPSGKASGKSTKTVDPDAPPKEKRPPNAWILFTIRVERLVRDWEHGESLRLQAEDPTAKITPLHTMAVKQFASSLKREGQSYDDITEAEMVEALKTWTPPETSKRAAAKAAAAAAAPPAEEGAEAAEAAEAAPAAEKPKRQWSEETKAAAAAKRAATLAKKAASGGGAAAAAAAAPAAAAPAPAGKPLVIKPKSAPAAKPLDLSFFPWTHEGKSYLTNDRGDVLTEDCEWVGRFDGKKIDETVSEPADLANATMRE